MAANAVIANYGMGITQHKHGVETVKMIVNLLLLRGNIGKPGAGISPIRGHSNVQGQRTVGISEKTKLVPLDKLAELYGFDPPRWDGLTTVDACERSSKAKCAASSVSAAISCVPIPTIADGASMVPAPLVGADRHQAQPQPPDTRRSDATCCLALAESRSTSKRAVRKRSSMEDSHRMHPRISRSAQTGRATIFYRSRRSSPDWQKPR